MKDPVERSDIDRSPPNSTTWQPALATSDGTAGPMKSPEKNCPPRYLLLTRRGVDSRDRVMASIGDAYWMALRHNRSDHVRSDAVRMSKNLVGACNVATHALDNITTLWQSRLVCSTTVRRVPRSRHVGDYLNKARRRHRTRERHRP